MCGWRGSEDGAAASDRSEALVENHTGSGTNASERSGDPEWGLRAIQSLSESYGIERDEENGLLHRVANADIL